MNAAMTNTSLFDKIEKPSKPHIMDSQTPVTKEELDEDELQIRLLLAEGRDIPDDLLERLKEKNKITPSDIDTPHN